ncbi:MAG: 5-methyltetrahydropteroyltriglutamate--homocysteine methyltransferase [Rhodothermales bacterium]
MNHNYYCDQVGSLIRPEKLLAARSAFEAGRIDKEKLNSIEDESVLEQLKMQQDVGIEIFSDGEMRRDAWQTNFSQAVEGFEGNYPKYDMETPEGEPIKIQFHTKIVSGKLQKVKRLAAVDARFMFEHSPAPFKITMPSPSHITISSFKKGITDSVYPDMDALRQDIVAIIKDEMQSLVQEGVTYLQLDEGFMNYCFADWRLDMKGQGIDPEKLLEAEIAADNTCYDASRKEGVTMAMHLCRGSRVSWMKRNGDYEWLAERLFDQLHVDRFLLEYDTDSAGGFEPLRFIPKNKIAVLGLVSSKNPTLESQNELLRRIDSASKHCPLERLALSPQCGFQGAATRDGVHMSPDIQKRKLELVVETARKVWG